jgi:alpha-aminoadipate/glutamate carrier protein LysW
MIGPGPPERGANRAAADWEVAFMAVCPECEADIEIDEYDVDKGEIISCPECGVDLEVVGLSPLELDVAPQEEDEWEE